MKRKQVNGEHGILLEEIKQIRLDISELRQEVRSNLLCTVSKTTFWTLIMLIFTCMGGLLGICMKIMFV